MVRMVVTLEVSKLSGWLNARVFCRVEKRACGAGRGAAREAVGGGRPWRTQRAGEGSTADWEQATREAHLEHGARVCDTGGVEAQRLVER